MKNVEKLYYNYHIVGVKIGTSVNPKSRVAKQGYTDYEILAKHTNKKDAADKEIELQKQYGYKVDTIRYDQFDYSKYGKINGKKVGAIYGKIQGKLNVENGHLEKIRKIAGQRAIECGVIDMLTKLKHKPVLVKKIDGSFVKKYSSLKEACEELKLHQGNASSVALGNRRKISGYNIKYI
jgi:hypothetical protein